MRQRIEDLGRLAVHLQNLIDHPLFDESSRPRRPKDSLDWFSALSNDQKEDVIRSWAYSIDDIQRVLYELLSIAEGTDLLNDAARANHQSP